MVSEIVILAGTAATLGFVHTVLGPDHYVPFIALARSRKWSGLKTFLITLLCGVAHILSSVIIGFIGIAMGIGLFRLELVESFRGELAAWFLLIFGITYFIWGVHRAVRNRSHEHEHDHKDGTTHVHPHPHSGCHTHVHTSDQGRVTPWALFIIFLFGPCEVLIPLLMYPAAQGHIINVVIVVLVYGFVTIATMLGIVMVSFHSLTKVRLRSYEPFSHPIAGLVIFICGVGMAFLGL
jgi:nickel/cobalt transporter (NicO) family protein